MALFKMNDDSLFSSLDIGSWGIRCAVFEKRSSFPPPILAFAEWPSQGLEESRVTDFKSLALSISSVLEEAEKLCQSSFSEVWAGWTPPLHSFCSHGMAVLPQREVTEKERDLALETACAVPLPDGHVLLHSRPQFFQVDGRPKVADPLSLSGLRLETQARLFSAPELYRRDINRILQALGYRPRAFFHNLVAYGEQLTTDEQKQNGVCLLDIGCKSSRGIVYMKGEVIAVFSFNKGGDDFSRAISYQLNIPLNKAISLKEKQGNLFYSDRDSPLSTGDSSYISRKLFAQTLEQTAKVFLERLKKELSGLGLTEPLGAGLVLTGQTSILPGFIDLLSFHLACPVSLPDMPYENFKQNCLSALPKQADSENLLSLKSIKRKGPTSRWPNLKELF